MMKKEDREGIVRLLQLKEKIIGEMKLVKEKTENFVKIKREVRLNK